MTFGHPAIHGVFLAIRDYERIKERHRRLVGPSESTSSIGMVADPPHFDIEACLDPPRPDLMHEALSTAVAEMTRDLAETRDTGLVTALALGYDGVDVVVGNPYTERMDGVRGEFVVTVSPWDEPAPPESDVVRPGQTLERYAFKDVPRAELFRRLLDAPRGDSSRVADEE